MCGTIVRGGYPYHALAADIGVALAQFRQGEGAFLIGST